MHALSKVFICIPLSFTQLITQSTVIEYMLTYICLVAQDWIASIYKYYCTTLINNRSY